MPDPVFMDLETRSEVDLKAAGGWVYAHHPSTEIISAVFKHKGRYIAWTPTLNKPVPAQAVGVDESYAGTELPEAVRELLVYPWAAHNAYHFDALVWETPGLDSRRFAPPVEWLDSRNFACQRGLPRGLEGAGMAVLGLGKDEVGHQSMLKLCQPHPKTGRFVPLTVRNIAPMLAYNVKDVLLLERFWEAEQRDAEEHGQPYRTPMEARVEEADRRINWRGIPFDFDLARKVVKLEETNREVNAEEQDLDRAMLRSNKQVAELLKSFDIVLPNLQQDTINAAIKSGSLPGAAVEILEARLVEKKISSKKLSKGLDMSHGGNLYLQLMYHSAHTGRWGGRGMQPQNLKSRGVLDTADTEEIISWLEGQSAQDPEKLLSAFREAFPGVKVPKAVGSCIRPCIRADGDRWMVVFDYASVESVGLSWVADDLEGLQDFIDGVDPYKRHVSKVEKIPYDQVSDKQRKFAKPAVLGCGYQLGGAGCAAYYAAVGGFTITEEEGQKIVEAWRDANPLIAGETTGKVYHGTIIRQGGLWKAVQAAATDAVKGLGPQLAGKCWWRMEGSHLICELPSGRRLVYRDARIEPTVPSWGGEPRDTLTYSRPLGKVQWRAPLWGGRLVENIVQAICRDLLAEALVRLVDAGYDVPFHVHDEIVWLQDTPDFRAAVEGAKLMAQTSQWAETFPVRVAGFMSKRYYKALAPGWTEAHDIPPEYRGLIHWPTKQGDPEELVIANYPDLAEVSSQRAQDSSALGGDGEGRGRLVLPHEPPSIEEAPAHSGFVVG